MPEITDETWLDYIRNAGNAPADDATGFDNLDWTKTFVAWASVGNTTADGLNAANIIQLILEKTELPELKKAAIDQGGAYTLSFWPAGVTLQVDRALQDAATERQAIGAMQQHARMQVSQYWPAFAMYVQEVQNRPLRGGGGGTDDNAAQDDLRETPPNQGAVDSVNQSALKNLQVGEYLYFWQRDGIVLLGNDHPRNTYLYFGGYEDGYKGTVQMDKKGGLLDTGKIFCKHDGSIDEGAFQNAIARFSKKKVKFGDYDEEDEDGFNPQGVEQDSAARMAEMSAQAARMLSDEYNVNIDWTPEHFWSWMGQREYNLGPQLLPEVQERLGDDATAGYQRLKEMVTNLGW